MDTGRVKEKPSLQFPMIHILSFYSEVVKLLSSKMAARAPALTSSKQYRRDTCGNERTGGSLFLQPQKNLSVSLAPVSHMPISYQITKAKGTQCSDWPLLSHLPNSEPGRVHSTFLIWTGIQRGWLIGGTSKMLREAADLG